MVALLLALPIAGYLVLTRTAVLTGLVVPAMQSVLEGAQVEADRVSLRGDRTLVVEGLRVRAVGVDGPAGQVLSAERLTARVHWGELLAGRAALREVEVIGPRVRVSRERGQGSVNLEGLRLAQRGAGPTTLPTVRLLGGVLELGEHDGADYRALRELDFTGQVTPAADGSGATVALSGTPGRADGVNLNGRIDDDGLTLALEDLRLDALPQTAVPSDLRPLFEEMDIRGRIATTRFAYASSGELRTTLELDGVSLNLPFGPELDQPARGDNAPVRMTDVTGTIVVTTQGVSAEFVGVAADLPHEVSLVWNGLRPDAEFRCTLRTRGYQLTESPGLLPIAPEGIRRRLASFSNPTATLDADVTIRRDPPSSSGAGEINASGEIRFRDGVAAFHDFPYQFRDLRGTAVFDRDRLELRDITGVSDSGARLSAQARIAPPRPGAAVEITVRTTDTPIDDRLLAAMGPSRASLVRALFNTAQYDALAREGLVLTPAAAAELRTERDRLRGSTDAAAVARSAEIERTLASTPVFPLTGECEAVVSITREPGMDTDWQRVITVRIPSAGMLPEHFPLPVLATDVELVIRDEAAEIVGGTFNGLMGGQARVRATAALRPGEPATSVVHVDATAVPIDARLIRAVPDARPGPGQRGLREILTDLGLEGVVSCQARVDASEDDAAFDVSLDVRGVRARPIPLAGGIDPGGALDLELTAGRVRAQNENVLLTLDGVLRGDGGAPAGHAELTLGVTNFGEQREPEVDGEVRVSELEAATPIERLIGVLAPDAARELASVRREFNPRGRATVLVTFDGPLEHEDAIGAEFTALDGLELDAFGSRVAFEQAGGRVLLHPLREGRLVLRRFSALLHADGRRVGALWAQGVAPMRGPWRGATDAGPADALRVELSDADFTAPKAREFLLSFAPGAVRGLADQYWVAGAFDAAIDLAPDPREPGAMEASGVIWPQRVSLERRGQRIAFERAWALVTFDRTGGAWAQGRASTPAWSMESDGSWSASPDGTVALQGTLGVDAPAGLSPEALALLPAPVADTLGALGVEFPGGLRVPEARVALTFPGDGSRVRFAAEGRLETGGAQLDPGAAIRDLIGEASFAAGDDGRSPPHMELTLHAIACEAAGATLTNAKARVSAASKPGLVAVPLITADLHGGRLVGAASVRTDPGESARYRADFRLSGVPLAELLEDWRTADVGPTEDVVAPATTGAPRDKSRGLVDGWIAIEGVAGDETSTTGRGEFVAGGGTVLELPLFIRLMKASNLQVPSDESLGLAESAFFLRGREIVFERLAVFAESIEVFGYGVIGWPERSLDLRLSSRAIRRLPVLSRVIETFRDELVTVQARGTIEQPEFSLVQFEGTRRILDRIQGTPLDEAQRRLLDAQRAALASRDRVRRVGDTVDQLPRATEPRSP